MASNAPHEREECVPIHAVRSRWWRRHAFVVRLAGLSLSVLLSILWIGTFDRTDFGTNIIWLANGLVLSFLLLAPRWRWPHYVGVAFVTMFLGSMWIGETPGMSLVYNALNMLEVLTGAFLLKRKSTALPAFTDGWFLLRFLGFACVLGPAIAAIPFGIFMHVVHHEDFLSVMLSWLVGDGLGVAVVTPTFVAVLESRMRNTHLLRRRWIYPLMVLLVTIIVFRLNSVSSPISRLSLPGAGLDPGRSGLGRSFHPDRSHHRRLVYRQPSRGVGYVHQYRTRVEGRHPPALSGQRHVHPLFHLHRLRQSAQDPE